VGWWSDAVPERELTRAEAERVMRRLFGMLKPRRWAMVVVALVLMAQAGALLAGPALVKYGIDKGLPHGSFDGDAGALNTAVALYLVMAFAGFILGRLAIVLVARLGEGFLFDLRRRLFSHMMRLSLDYFETEKTGRIVARMTSDVDALQELISQGLVLFVQNIFLFVGAVVIVLLLSLGPSFSSRTSRGSLPWACSSSCRRCTSRAAGSGASRTRLTSTCVTAFQRT
jgi:ATP-binding cassette subfamily B protein